MQIVGEDIKQIPLGKFSISASESGYTLRYSADCNSWSSWATPVPANEVAVVNAVPNMYWQLSGNTSTVFVQF